MEASHVSSFRTLQDSTLASLSEQPLGSLSGFLQDGRLCWIACGACLEVLDVATGWRRSAWKFGQSTANQNMNITCVKELANGMSLLVGVCDGSSYSLLCVFDMALSKVTKCIEIPQPITEIEVVCTCSRDRAPRWALSEHLSYFCGLVAVGTNTGHVMMIDLCIDDKEFYSDEKEASKLHYISPRILDIENQRFQCMSQGLHLAMQLNETYFTDDEFLYEKPDGQLILRFDMDCVSVTCLKYIPQAGLLVVGYSFGGFQLWKLSVPVLEYSCRLETEPNPVTHIAYQQPENDPKNFCYMWIARGQQDSEQLDSVCSIALYQFAFRNKAYYSNYGVYYDELSSVCLRMDHELTSSLVQSAASRYEGGSRMISCFTLTDPLYKPPVKLNNDDSFEDSTHGPDLSLCMFVWEATVGNLSSTIEKHLSIFDINCWYHAQMPSTIRFNGGAERCTYFSWRKLNSVCNQIGDDNLLALYLDASAVEKFDSFSSMPPEQHFYPSALSFDASLLFETGIGEAQYLGGPRQVLSQLQTHGASSLVQPQELYRQCVQADLLPRPTGPIQQDMVLQRESLLNLALEHGMLSLFKACIQDWANGEYEPQGCSFKMLLDWAWDSVSKLKHKTDLICVPLYDWSGQPLDTHSLKSLILCYQRLATLISVLKLFVSSARSMTDQGALDLDSKLLVASLLFEHLDVVLWFVHAGLLPEIDDTEESFNGLYCYPVTSLILAYKQRRAELESIHSESITTDLLMIDGMVEHLGVQELWNREGGNGLYPPPSLHALLECYLQKTVDVMSIHCLVLYLLLDLLALDDSADSEKMSNEVSSFGRRFNIPLSMINQVKGFWLLDHQDFKEGVGFLLHPMVDHTQMSSWQHWRIIKALLYQGEAKLALRYMSLANPPLNTPEEVKLKLTLLLANRLTVQAVGFQRVCRDKASMNDLLSHLFLGCQHTKTMDRLLQLHLDQEEESALVQHLIDSSDWDSQDLLFMHYLKRGKFLEAMQFNEKLKLCPQTEVGILARERTTARETMIEQYISILPRVQRKLLFDQSAIPKKKTNWKREVSRPRPLSTKVTQSRAKVTSQASYIMSIMESLDELEMRDSATIPFIGTPMTPHNKSLTTATPVTVYPKIEEDRESSILFHQHNSAHSTSLKFVSAACLTLLQTPPVTKMTPRKTLSTSKVITPQSILKVRNLNTTTSPSPKSYNTTPNSQELENTGKKVPRKLGFGATTPLSGLPRHLTALSSQPSSPKSVSFRELPDDSPTSPEPRSATTPKTAFNISTFRALATPSTPPLPRSSLARKSTRADRSRESPEQPTKAKTGESSPEAKRRKISPQEEPKSTDSVSNLAHADTIDIEEVFDTPDNTTDIDTSMDVDKFEDATEAPEPSAKGKEMIDEEIEVKQVEQTSKAKDQSRSGSAETSPIKSSSRTSSRPSPQRSPSGSPQRSPLRSPNKSLSRSPSKSSPIKSQTTDRSPGTTSSATSLSRSSIRSSPAKSSSATTSAVQSQSSISPSRSSPVKIPSETSPVRSSSRRSPGANRRTLLDEDDREIPDSEFLQISVAELKRKSLTPMSERNLPILKKDSPESKPGTSVSPAFSERREKQLKEINELFSDSPDQSDSNFVQMKTKTEHTIVRKPFKLESLKSISDPTVSEGTNLEEEMGTVKTESESTVKQESSVDSTAETMDSQDVKSSDVDEKSADEHLEQPLTRPKRKSQRISQSPETRSGHHQTRHSENLVEISSSSRRQFTKDAKEAVQESLLQISEDLINRSEQPVDSDTIDKQIEQETEHDTPTTPPRSRKKTETVSSSKATTPRRGGQKTEVETDENNSAGSEKVQADTAKKRSPTRGSRAKKKEHIADTSEMFGMTEIPEHKDDVVDAPGTPSRRQSLSRACKIEIPEELVQTPTKTTKGRGKAAEDRSPSTEQGKSPSRRARRAETPDDSTMEDAESLTPSRRGRGRKSLANTVVDVEATETDEHDEEPSTPSRRGRVSQTPTRSRRGRAKKTDESIIEETTEKKVTPSRRGRSKKTDESIIEETTEKPVTPSRRGRSKKTDESIIEETTEKPVTPSRRGRYKKTDESIIEETTEKPVTPSRRGRPKKTDESIIEETTEKPVTPSRRGQPKKTDESIIEETTEKPVTPSRRGRAKKTDESIIEETTEKPVTPSRRGRPKKTDESIIEETTEKPVTPSRRGRHKKVDESVIEEIAEKPVTPSRRGRPKKTDESFIEETIEKPVTPSRRGRHKKVDESVIEEIAEKPVTPSRRGRPKKTDESFIEETMEKPVTPSRRGQSKRTEETTAEETTQQSASRGRGRSKTAKSESEDESSDRDKQLTPSRRNRSKKEETGIIDDPITTQSQSTSFQVYDVQSFQFSDPMEVDNVEESAAPKAFSQSRSFIFSPPISRKQSVDRTLMTETTKHTKSTEQTVTSGQTKIVEQTKSVEVTETVVEQTTQKPKSRRMRKLYAEKEELLLISPTGVQFDSGDEGKTTAKMKRTRKGQTTHEESKKLVNTLIAKTASGRRKGYRMGPITRTKYAKQ